MRVGLKCHHSVASCCGPEGLPQTIEQQTEAVRGEEIEGKSPPTVMMLGGSDEKEEKKMA
jgi:hypothetical protein